MDKKNTTIGVLLLIVAGYLFFNEAQKVEEIKAQAAVTAMSQQGGATALSSGTQKPEFATQVSETELKPQEEEEFFTLENGTIKARVSNYGALLKDITFLNRKRSQDENDLFILNEAEALNSLSVAISNKGDIPSQITVPFKMVEKGENAVRYEAVVDGLKIKRSFGLDPQNKKSYSSNSIWTETSVENMTGADLSNKELWLGLGSALPTEGDINNSNLEVGAYDGDDAEFYSYTKTTGSDGFMGFWETPKNDFFVEEFPEIVWAVVKNQPYAAIFTGEEKKGYKLAMSPVNHDLGNKNKLLQKGVSAYVAYPIDTLKAGETWTLSGFYYAGPKDIYTLVDMGQSQDLAMNFGFFSFISKPLLMFLNFIHDVVAKFSQEWAWGWSIVILTCVVRLIMFPLTNKQYRSSMRMSLLATPVKAIREKYKSDPQRAQREVFALYGEYGINPMAGCLPALIQLPIFLGLYFMLQSVGDFRFAHFLWISDLALPDTIASMPTIFGMPLHVLPIINAIITVIQMSLTPMPSAEPSQKIMMKVLPVVLLLLFYSFPSGLLLYWTVQSSFGLIQLLYVRATKESLEEIKAKKKPSKPRTKPSFLEKMQAMAEQAQKMKEEQERLKNKAKSSKKH